MTSPSRQIIRDAVSRCIRECPDARAVLGDIAAAYLTAASLFESFGLIGPEDAWQIMRIAAEAQGQLRKEEAARDN